MREVHIIGEPPTVTKIPDRPPQRWHAVPITNPVTTTRPPQQNPRVVIMRTRNDGTWAFDGTTTTVPPSVNSITYRHEPGDLNVPILLPPVASLPLVTSLSFRDLPIQSVAEIGNLDEYRPILRSISFLGCTSLVIDDLTWFIPVSIVDLSLDPARRRPASANFFININRCHLRSLRGMEQFQRVVSLHVEDCGLDLGNEIATIEAYRTTHGGINGALGDMSIGGNFIGGRKVLKRKGMMTGTAIAYIRQWMAKRGA
jgi:hypothetical protein